MRKLAKISLPLVILLAACNNRSTTAAENKNDSTRIADSSVTNVDSLPAPDTTKSVTNRSDVIGWENGKMPTAAEGFTVSKFADGSLLVADDGGKTIWRVSYTKR